MLSTRRVVSVLLVAMVVLVLAFLYGCQDEGQGESRSSEAAAQERAAEKTGQTQGRDLSQAQGELPSEVSKIMDSSFYRYGEWGYLEVDPSNGRTVRALGPPDRLYIPGSATKLFSVSATLDELGFDHRFQTPVYAQGEVKDNKLTGELVLVASGDLTMGGRTTPDGKVAYTSVDHTYANDVPGATLTPEDPLAGLDEIAEQVRESGITRVDGNVEARGDELGQLGRSLGEMARSLANSEKELVEQTRVRTALSRYLSADVVELIAREPGRLRLGGERREVTVLFSDVVGFTRLSESLPPETVVALLNELFTFATEIIHKRGGIIDKFIGDSVMAVWGTPESHPDDARQAVEAAMELRRWVETGNRRWKQKWGVEVQLAMGLHTGTVVAGNLGSEKRMEYTVIGDAVNVAARLESMAQPGQILVSAATREKLGEEAEVLRHLGERALHGRNATTQVFEVAA